MKYLTTLFVLLLAGVVSATLNSHTGYRVGWTNYDPGAWTSTTLTKVSDDQYATIPQSNADSFAVITLNLTVPQDVGTTVDSADIQIEGNCTSSTTARRVYYFALTTDGGITAAGNWCTDTLNQTTDATHTFNGSSGNHGEGNRTFGATLTPANVASGNFGVMVKKLTTAFGSVHNIDLITVKVWWTSPTAAEFGRGTNNFVETYVRQNAATTNYNTDTSFAVGSNTGLGDARVWIFRVPGLAAYMAGKSNIDGQLVLHTLANTYPDFNDSLAFQIVRQANRFDWDTATATYNIYKTATNWGTAGAFNTSTDIFSTNYSKWDSTEYRDNGYMTIDVSELLRAYTDSIFTMREYGANGGTVMSSHSSNCSTAAFKPYLVVWQGVAASSTRPRRRRDDLSMLDRIRIYSFTDKGALQCAGQ